MADYEGIYGVPDNSRTINISATSFYPNENYHVPPSNNYHGVDIDTATIVSIASSCIILISGCIAVVCLIMYMKKTDMLYRSRTCAKCGAHVARDESASSRVPIRNDSSPVLNPNQMPNLIYQSVMEAQQSVKKGIGSIAIFRGIGSNSSAKDSLPPKFVFAENITNDSNPSTSNNPSAEFIQPLYKAEKEMDFFEDDEPTPYATFNLPGFETDAKIGETYETFATKFTEPPYMLLKKGLDCPAPPQYADSVDYKMRLIENVTDKLTEENIYQSTGLSQCHSIASCSSNHDELIRAYEYGKLHNQKLMKIHDEFIECLNENDNDETFYRSLPSERESPTDPGIREFTKSPPKPNEKRQGIVFHPTTNEMIEIAITNINNDNEYCLKSTPNPINESPKNDLSSNETTSNSFSSIQSSREVSSNDSTPSLGSDSANNAEESSSSTTTMEQFSILPEEVKQFGAIPRDRSRNPSWASFTTMKSNTALTPQYSGNEPHNTERSFVTQSNSAIKEGLSSDDELNIDNRAHGNFEKRASRSQDMLEEIYGSSRLAAYNFGNNNSGSIANQATAAAAAVVAKDRTDLFKKKTTLDLPTGTNHYDSLDEVGAHQSQGPSQMVDKVAMFTSPGLQSIKNAPSIKKISEIDC